jgi:hypothetical protein
MILHLIERYTTLYWIIFIGFIAIKIIFSVEVEGKIHGMIDVFVVLFRWYDHVTRAMAESKELSSRMRVLNLITIGIVISLLVVLVVSLMRSYL